MTTTLVWWFHFENVVQNSENAWWGNQNFNSPTYSFSTRPRILDSAPQRRSLGGPPGCVKNTKKRYSLEESCLQASDRSKNMLSVQHGFELLCGNNRLPNQFLLSSEIGPFEDQPSKNPRKSMIFIGNPYCHYWGYHKDLIRILLIFKDFWKVCLQMELSWSSRGVDWANGYCHIVIRTCAARWACF